MYLKYNNDENEYCKLNYSDKENTFELKTMDNTSSIIFVPKLHLHAEYDPMNYEMIFLQNDAASENSIYPIYADDKRIGWIFPIQALLSTEHERAENMHFLKYAYVAIYKLLDLIEDKDSKEQSTDLLLTDYYSSDKQILLIDKDNITQIEDFNIDSYVLSLFIKGYTFIDKGHSPFDLEIVDKNLRIKSLPKDLKSAGYINILFKNLIPIEMEAFAKFHLLYQVVEMLISGVFDSEFSKFITRIDSEADKLFDNKDRLNDIINEKKRVSMLMSSYTRIPFQKKERLNKLCVDILKKSSRTFSAGDDEADMPKNVYAVRCLIVHTFYVLDKELYEDILNDLNEAFLDVVIEMVQSYSTP